MATDPYDDPLNLPEDNSRSATPHSSPASAKKPLRKKIIMGVIFLLVIAGLAFAAALLTSKKTPSSSTKTTKTTPAATLPGSITPSKDLPDATGSKTYDNGPLGLNLTYPSTWTAAETTDNGVRVESPVFTYQNLLGESTSGNFRIYIRKGARPVDSKYIGRGVAILPSEKLVYAKPAVGQRSDTWLSSFGLDTGNNFGFFMIAGNFQLKVGDTLGPSYGTEPETFIVSGGYSSKELKDDMQTVPVPTDYITTSNAFKQAITIIKSLQLT